MSISSDERGNAAKFFANNIVKGGSQTVASAGTAVQLDTTSIKNCEVVIRAKTANTNNIYVGFSDVDDTAGIVLDASETVTLAVVNLNKIYIDADTNGEGVNFSYIT